MCLAVERFLVPYISHYSSYLGAESNNPSPMMSARDQSYYWKNVLEILGVTSYDGYTTKNMHDVPRVCCLAMKR